MLNLFFAILNSTPITIRGESKPCKILISSNIASDNAPILELAAQDLKKSLKFEIAHNTSTPIEKNYHYHYLIELDITRPTRPDLYLITIKIIDSLSKQLMHSDSFEYTIHLTEKESWRNLSHKISDYIFEKIQGVKGHFSTKIAFVKKFKIKKHKGPKTILYLADYDGYNIKEMLASHDIIICPHFSPCGNYLIYRTLNLQKGQTAYLLDIHNKTITNLSEYIKNKLGKNIFGKNISALGFGKNSYELLFAKSKNGTSTLHSLDLTTGQYQTLTPPQKYFIQTCPTKILNGESLLFSADTNGKETLYILDKNNLVPLPLTHSLRFSQPHMIQNVKSNNRLFFSGRGQGYSSIWFIDVKPDTPIEQMNTENLKPIVVMRRPYFVEQPVPLPNGLYVAYTQQSLGGINEIVIVDERGNEVPGDDRERGLLTHLGTNITDIAWSY